MFALYGQVGLLYDLGRRYMTKDHIETMESG